MSSKKATGTSAKARRVAVITPEWMERRLRDRRFEWVELDDGTEVCVWSSNLGDTLSVIQASARPGVFQELGPDEASGLRTQIMVSCYNGEPPVAERVFDGIKAQAIDVLSPNEMHRILTASSRLNGTDQITTEAIEAFMKRNGGGS